MKKVALIGSTGSIGRQVVETVKRHSDKFKIVAIVSGSGGELFERQIAELNPRAYAVASTDKKTALEIAAMSDADIIFNAAGGFAGLEYSLKAVTAGKRLALANKETLVCGGDVVLPLAERSGAEILPVDSEHSAIWQCLNFSRNTPVRRLIITASGGAFRDMPKEKLDGVTPEMALAHPTWKMGAKITVDSATLMNKGYEVIEAHVLYNVPYKSIEAVIQPQSIIHSLVEFDDGAVLAQMSYPTMELPIQLALSFPQRFDTALAPMDFKRAFSLDFKPLSREAFPCFDLALKCGEAGGIMPCVLNAADEVAVKAFLDGKIKFTDICRVVDGVLQGTAQNRAEDFNTLLSADAAAREKAHQIIKRL